MRLAPAARVAPRDERSGDQPPPRPGGTRLQWPVRLRLPLASAEEIKRHFEQRIRERWGSRVPEPPADVFVLSEEIWVELDLPGVPESGVRAYVERDELVVEARREIQPPPGTLSTARRERSPGVIERRVPLPPMHRSPRLEIHLESGVLRVRVLWEEPP